MLQSERSGFLTVIHGYMGRSGNGMNAEKRRENILKLLAESDSPLSGTDLAKCLAVSRQVIVQDIALIKP